MVARSQRRLLARRSGGAGAADADGPALRLRDHQCRSPDARPALAAALDATHAGGTAPEPMPEYITLVTRGKVADAIATPDGAAFVRDVVPSYLMKRRWFSAKDQTIRSTKIRYMAPLPDGSREVLLAEVETKCDGEVN